MPRAFKAVLACAWLGCMACAGWLSLGLFGCRHTPGPAEQWTMDMRPRPAVLGSGSRFTGYEYVIRGQAATNHPDALTNVLPKRVHVDLSTDGGVTFPRRVAYGVPVEADRRTFEVTWSPPWWDRGLITEQAVLRFSDLAGEPLGRSMPFTLAGMFALRPADGDVLFSGSLEEISWLQAGAGGEVELSYISPIQTGMSYLATFSNCVAGTNTRYWSVSCPTGAQVRLVWQSASDRRVICASEVFEVR